MKNEIYISDRMVTIPEMAIHSSAFNISVSGQQTFDNVFEYRLNVLLSEVLFNKARKRKKEIDEFLQEENQEIRQPFRSSLQEHRIILMLNLTAKGHFR